MRKTNCKQLLQYTFQLLAFVLLSVQTMAGIDRAMIEFKKTPLKKALEKISEVYRVTFTYDPSVVETGIRVDLDRRERTLQEVLDYLSGRAGLSFLQSGDMIGVKQLRQQPAAVLQQDVTVSGQVVDADNQPLEGVSVTLKGSNRGVVTNAEGNFRITVPSGSTIVFSIVDYQTVEVTADPASVMKITLQQKPVACRKWW